MAAFAAVLLLLVVPMVDGVIKVRTGNGHRRNVDAAHSFVAALRFSQRLRVCNAYPYVEAMEIFVDGKVKLTSETPMPYKSCKEFQYQLQAGDKLDFHMGETKAGTFSVAELPQNDAVLLLVIHRHDTLSSTVAFESHVFSSLGNAQVAVIDTYKGSAKSKPRITDFHDEKNKRVEELRYDSVVAVNQGEYMVVLNDESGTLVGKKKLVALDKESYVVMRAGVEAVQGQSYPQELIVYPQSDAALLHSGTPNRRGVFACLLPTLAMMSVRL